MIHQLLASLYRLGVGSTAWGEGSFIRNEDLNTCRARKIRSPRHECSYETRISAAMQADRVSTRCLQADRRVGYYKLMSRNGWPYEIEYVFDESG